MLIVFPIWTKTIFIRIQRNVFVYRKLHLNIVWSGKSNLYLMISSLLKSIRFFSCHNFIYTRCEIICCLRMCMSKSVSVSFSKGDIITHGDLDNLRVIRIILQKDQKQPCRVSTYSRFKCIITFVFKPEVAPHKKHYQIKLNLNKFNTSIKESVVMNITILE